MENNQNNDNTLSSPEDSNPSSNPSGLLPEIKLTPLSIEFLREAAKWSKILAILGLIGIGFYLLIIIFFSLFYVGFSSNFGSNQFGLTMIPMLLIMIIIIALYFAPIWWLFKFGSNLQEALNSRSTEQLTIAFKYLQKHYKYIGIMFIIGIILYFLSFIGLITSGVLNSLSTHT